MNNSIMPFEFKGKKLRVEGNFENPLFNANDVCAVLKYSNQWDAIKRHVHKDDLVKREVIDNLGRTQFANYVNESGLYSLIFGAHTASAKTFTRFITSEVLPTLRKTGSYSLGNSNKELLERVESLEKDLITIKEESIWQTREILFMKKAKLLNSKKNKINKTQLENITRMKNENMSLELISLALGLEMNYVNDAIEIVFGIKENWKAIRAIASDRRDLI
jgi:prophage antirepressor-like protein